MYIRYAVSQREILVIRKKKKRQQKEILDELGSVDYSQVLSLKQIHISRIFAI